MVSFKKTLLYGLISVMLILSLALTVYGQTVTGTWVLPSANGAIIAGTGQEFNVSFDGEPNTNITSVAFWYKFETPAGTPTLFANDTNSSSPDGNFTAVNDTTVIFPYDRLITLNFTAYNESDLVASAELTGIALNNSALTAGLVSPANGNTTTESDVYFLFRPNEEVTTATLTINGATTTLSGNTTSTNKFATVNLPDGTHDWTFSFTEIGTGTAITQSGTLQVNVDTVSGSAGGVFVGLDQEEAPSDIGESLQSIFNQDITIPGTAASINLVVLIVAGLLIAKGLGNK